MFVSLKDVPRYPAIYALQGRSVGNRPVGYVGQATNLRTRLRQHLVLRDSSITTGAKLVSLNPDLVRGVEWWTHDLFSDSTTLTAAELVAFDVLDPTLRSEGTASKDALNLSSTPQFKKKFRQVFSGPPSGTLPIESLAELSVRVEDLEARLTNLENEMKLGEGKTP